MLMRKPFIPSNSKLLTTFGDIESHLSFIKMFTILPDYRKMIDIACYYLFFIPHFNTLWMKYVWWDRLLCTLPRPYWNNFCHWSFLVCFLHQGKKENTVDEIRFQLLGSFCLIIGEHSLSAVFDGWLRRSNEFWKSCK